MAHEQKREAGETQARWDSVQMVHPGENFPLYHPARNGTTIRYDDNGMFGGIASHIRLQTGFFDPLNLSITSAPYALPKAAVLTPFERQKGYPLDQEDFAWRSRCRKLLALKDELTQVVNGLGLVVFASYEDLPLHSMMRASLDDHASSLAPEIASLLGRVYLILSFPGGSSFAARAIFNLNRLLLLFRTFFPIDTGPLPVGESLPPELDPLSVQEGFRVLLPFNLAQAQTIEARFVLLPE